MPQDWRIELNRIGLLLLGAGFIGVLLGNILLVVIITLAAYLVYFLYQLYRLNKWLRDLATDVDIAPPEGPGIWGMIFDGIYRLQRGERKASAEIQHILDRAQKSVAALDIAVVMIDKAGNLEWWNNAAETFLGIRYPEDRGQTATNLIRSPHFSEYFASEVYPEPLRITSPVNNNIMLELQITLFGEHEKLMVARDISQIHTLELMRKDFVANVSHELRTPITVIIGYLETLMDNSHHIDEQWHKPLEQMHQQSKRVENIVSDLLVLSRLETKAISLQQSAFNVRGLLEEIKRDTVQVFEEYKHTIRISCDDSIGLTGNRGELYSAISNLVFNAAKYTPEGGSIQLVCEETDDSIDISVIDNGIGIEEQHIARLTERFYRVDISRSTSTGGTGLGLAIVKHILIRHGASLEITSKPGKGSCFKCRFPVRNSSSSESNTAP
ncbi:MAG: phosphate regulon sensor histidine kinase PhoR [Gammaproteobacteria bacterium]|nr:phosphate regulon sensor histidine kinase PhoR [Gammaproteobacteria bacterium]